MPHENLVNGRRPSFHFMSLSAPCRESTTRFFVYAESCDGGSILLGAAASRTDALSLARMVKVDLTRGIAGVRIEKRILQQKAAKARQAAHLPRKRRSRGNDRAFSFFRRKQGIIDFASLGEENNI